MIDWFNLLLFNYLCLWKLALSSTKGFPLPGTWIFNDPMQLFLNDMCFTVYADYLQKKEPESYELLLEVMQNLMDQADMYNSVLKLKEMDKEENDSSISDLYKFEDTPPSRNSSICSLFPRKLSESINIHRNYRHLTDAMENKHFV